MTFQVSMLIGPQCTLLVGGGDYQLKVWPPPAPNRKASRELRSGGQECGRT